MMTDYVTENVVFQPGFTRQLFFWKENNNIGDIIIIIIIIILINNNNDIYGIIIINNNNNNSNNSNHDHQTALQGLMVRSQEVVPVLTVNLLVFEQTKTIT